MPDLCVTLTMASSPHHHLLLLLPLMLLSLDLRPVSSDMASDRAECADQLVGLATCLQYVEGNTKFPTPDCCSGLKTVLAKSPKCLCVLIKDRDDPQLGIKINASRALTLPSTCGVPVAISECPKLLNLPPNSKEAQVFKQSGITATGNSTEVKGSSGGSTGSASVKSIGGDGGGSLINLWGVLVVGLVLLLQTMNI